MAGFHRAGHIYIGTDLSIIAIANMTMNLI